MTKPDIIVVVSDVSVDVVEIGVVGPQGIQGIQGIAGSGAFQYVHDQMTPSASWSVVHNLGGYPNVTVVNSAGDEVVGDIDYVDTNNITLSFMSAFAGKAYLS